MPALPDPTPDIFHAAAERIVDLFAEHVGDTDARVFVDELADVLEEVLVRSIDLALTTAFGIPPKDTVSGIALRVWDVVRDLRTRLDRAESFAERTAERVDVVVEDQRHHADRIGKLGEQTERTRRRLAAHVADL